MSEQREVFKGLSAAEFFYRNREIAGFSNPTRALYQTVRELVENALDATELYGILPEIKVVVTQDKNDPMKVFVDVSDNGIGVPPEEIPSVFARVFYGSKYVLRQTRGIFGLGIKMAVLYSQITTGKPIYIKSSTPESPIIAEYELMIDIKRNMPIIISERVARKRRKTHGTHVRLCLEGNWQQARRRVEEYIKRTAMITPYATLILEAPGTHLVFKRTTKVMPSPPRIGKPHPYGVDIEMLKHLFRNHGELYLKEFIVTCFDGAGETTAADFLKWSGLRNKKLKNLAPEEIATLSKKLKEYPYWRRPRPVTLSPVGEKLLKKGLKSVLRPEYVAAVSRKPLSYRGNPFIVEVALAWGGEIPAQEKPLLYRYANKIPLLYDEGADVSRRIVDTIDWSNYKVKFPAPLAVVVHVCSTKVPFKGIGKEAIADVPELEKEIENAIKDAARKLRAHITMVERVHEVIRRKVTFSKYVPEIARSLAEITNMEEEIFEEKLFNMLEREVKKTAQFIEETKITTVVKSRSR
ncbi:MAG: DNA topoisomerase VI subunit B [Thermoprotei archaeon]|nr:MAG: DNA topoisomerase VI subunit B [Thermoprotei archaeon]RLE82272.1 MAG: DNA topoisomerase VI subunit B [Thermoprotei archaeon]RLF02984.1 MAG: DNA topoisomerase VI subunit B [Thermoprotei archaeon]